MSQTQNEMSAIVINAILIGLSRSENSKSFFIYIFITNDPTKPIAGWRLWAIDMGVCKVPKTGPLFGRATFRRGAHIKAHRAQPSSGQLSLKQRQLMNPADNGMVAV